MATSQVCHCTYSPTKLTQIPQIFVVCTLELVFFVCLFTLSPRWPQRWSKRKILEKWSKPYVFLLQVLEAIWTTWICQISLRQYKKSTEMVFTCVFAYILLFVIKCRFPANKSIAEIIRNRYDDDVLAKVRRLETWFSSRRASS